LPDCCGRFDINDDRAYSTNYLINFSNYLAVLDDAADQSFTNAAPQDCLKDTPQQIASRKRPEMASSAGVPDRGPAKHFVAVRKCHITLPLSGRNFLLNETCMIKGVHVLFTRLV
jgi:hypothetical protein